MPETKKGLAVKKVKVKTLKKMKRGDKEIPAGMVLEIGIGKAEAWAKKGWVRILED